MTNFSSSDAVSADFGIFGIPTTYENSKIILLPVPWEVTTSYGSGASHGPLLIRQASEQIDLFDLEVGNAFEAGYFMLPYPKPLKKKNDLFKKKAQELIELKTNLSKQHKKMQQLTNQINTACEEMVQWVYEASKQIILDKKILGLVGGDHSTPLGALKAIAETQKKPWGVLHIDAHADLRKSYMGLKHSHASIMYNVMHAPWKPNKLVQVGIRDFCEEEYNLSKERADIETFYDLNLKKRLFSGENWSAICRDIISQLPDHVYISFDIDGLDPQFCPNTGTPVPGGLSSDQVFCLFSELAKSGKKIIGFDLNEVSSGGQKLQDVEWDGNVGARMLYKLCGWTVLTNSK